MTTQTVQPNRGLLRQITRPLRFAFHHPIEAVLLAFLLWIALTGLTEANWVAVPQNGIAQTVIAGEQQAFQEKVGVHVPAITHQARDLVAGVIDVTSKIAAAFVATFANYLMRDLNLTPATSSPGK